MVKWNETVRVEQTHTKSSYDRTAHGANSTQTSQVRSGQVHYPVSGKPITAAPGQMATPNGAGTSYNQPGNYNAPLHDRSQ